MNRPTLPTRASKRLRFFWGCPGCHAVVGSSGLSNRDYDESGEAYLRDLPKAELHRLESGHFAVEDCLDVIAQNIRRFYDEKVAIPRKERRTA